MRVLIIQSNGEHDENRFLRECFSIQYAFQFLGHEADVWGKNHNTPTPDFDSYDLIFTIENYDFTWLPDLSQFKPMKLQWIIDLHCNESMHYSKYAKSADVILHSTRSLIDRFQSKFCPDKRNIWFPNAVDSRYFNGAAKRNKVEDVVFVGSVLKERQGFIDRLKGDVGLRQYKVLGHEMIDKVAGAKIHFNKNIKCDVNYRTFETIALGTCLVTNFNSEMLDLGFIHGVNCYMYNNYNEAVDCIKRALAGEYIEVAAKGFSLSLTNTYIDRVRELLRIL